MPDTDTRIVYGAQCMWWDSITEVGRSQNGMPCCPHCHSMLFEMENEEAWWVRIVMQSTAITGYTELIKWSRSKCFPTYHAAKAAFDQAHESKEQNND